MVAIAILNIMRRFVILVFIFGLFSQIGCERNLTTFEFNSSNGNLNGSVFSNIYNSSHVNNDKVAKNGEQPTAISAVNSSKTNGSVAPQNGSVSGNYTERASFAIFNPDFWKNLLGIFSGNVKVGIHGDLSNVASGNLESRGSVGLSVNGQDLTVGAKFGIGGNLGQGISNTGSIGAGGKIAAKPSVKFTRPKLSLASLPLFARGNHSEVNSDGGNGNWQNIKQYFKFFVDKPQ